MNMIELAERGQVPDALIRIGIRRLLRKRLAEQHAADPEAAAQSFARQIEQLRRSEIALETDAANAQHYEVPAAFYRQVLGRHLKYSSAEWGGKVRNLDEAEARMLRITCERAGLADGQQVLELGCGWGSLSLWMARNYPSSRIISVSNSASQREYILGEADRLGLANLEVLTCDVNQLELQRQFDRVVSVEMFEHVRNYHELMRRISGWLVPRGRLFVHIFCHRYLMYPFEIDGNDDWMGRHFFTGGLMPSADTLLWFQDDLKIRCRWLVDGRHYGRTARAWLERIDRNRSAARDALAPGTSAPDRQLQRWRMFFMACEELFAFAGGREWMVGHFLFEKPGSRA
ncbi:MAG: class I SAM-dependent methyltransferase [Gammaproteobacteria bacterium]|nr:class I SAM-dependent methyltransferase [Gammaproteobacteria bacterium]